MKQHTYTTSLEWTGNEGSGTKNFRSYRRDFTIAVEGKKTIEGSSDPAYKGDPTRYNPEEMLVSGLSSCHMLWYLHLCSVKAITVVDYRDQAEGIMEETADGSGTFKSVQLNPQVTILEAHQAEKAAALHHEAHDLCLIARSVNFPVHTVPTITVSAPAPEQV
jgi:organic hydroperoxide reductase OsmC/OhrA